MAQRRGCQGRNGRGGETDQRNTPFRQQRRLKCRGIGVKSPLFSYPHTPYCPVPGSAYNSFDTLVHSGARIACVAKTLTFSTHLVTCNSPVPCGMRPGYVLPNSRWWAKSRFGLLFAHRGECSWALRFRSGNPHDQEREAPESIL